MRARIRTGSLHLRSLSLCLLLLMRRPEIDHLSHLLERQHRLQLMRATGNGCECAADDDHLAIALCNAGPLPHPRQALRPSPVAAAGKESDVDIQEPLCSNVRPFIAQGPS